MKKIICFLAIIFLLPSSVAFAATITLKWDASTGATGYKIEQCTTAPATGPWTLLKDVPGGAVLTTTVTVPDTGTIYMRLAPYNANGPLPRTSAGTWYNGSLALPSQGTGFSIP